MIILIILGVIALIAMIVTFIRNWSALVSFFLIPLTFITVLLIGNEIIFDCYITTTQEQVVTEEYAIKSLTNSTETSGQFTLGTGSINSKRMYYYLVENDDGSFEENSIPIEYTKIIYTDDTEAKIQVKEYSYSIWLCCIPSHWFSDGRNYVVYLPEKTSIKGAT